MSSRYCSAVDSLDSVLFITSMHYKQRCVSDINVRLQYSAANGHQNENGLIKLPQQTQGVTQLREHRSEYTSSAHNYSALTVRTDARQVADCGGEGHSADQSLLGICQSNHS